MTAEAFALLLAAQRAGQSKWKACCPAHDDRRPSLSIREGRNGRVLIHCFVGCSTTSILTALGLGRADLFAGPPPTPSQLAALVAQREEREAVDRELRQELRDASDAVRKWWVIADTLGDKTASAPDAEKGKFAKLWHDALYSAREAERVADELVDRAAALRRTR